MRETWKNSVENIVSTVTATHNPQRYFGPSSVSGNVQTQRYRHTHTSLKTPNLSTCLLHFPPAQRSQLSLPLLIDVGMRPGIQENPALHGGCWGKLSSPWIKGRGPVLYEVPGKKHRGCCCHSKCWGVQIRWERDKKDSVLAYEENLMQPVPSWGLSTSNGISKKTRRVNLQPPPFQTDVLGIFQSLEKGSK